MHAIEVHELGSPTTASRPCAGSASRSDRARSSGCSGRTAPGRRRRSRSSRATGGASRRGTVLGIDPRRPGPTGASGSASSPSRGELFPNLTVMEHLELFAGYYAKPSPPPTSSPSSVSSTSGTRGRARSRAGRSGGSTSGSRSSATPSCCSSTSRRRGSIPAPGERPGRRSGRCARSARRSC